MKTSPNGAPVMTGKGLQDVLAQVERRFAEARESGMTPLVPSRVESQRITIEKRERTLMEKAAPLLEEIGATGMPHRRDMYCWEIGDEIRIEDAPKLFEAALAALSYQPRGTR